MVNLPKIDRRNSVRADRNARTKDQQDALNHVRQFVDYETQAPEREVYEQTWFRDTMYYAGQQYGIEEPDGRVRAPRGNSNQQYYTANLVLPYAVRATSKISSQNFQTTVAPKSSRVEDRDAAKLAQRVNRHLDNILDYQRKSRTALRMSAMMGSGFLKFWWDPEAGTPTRIYQHPENGIQVDLPPDVEREYDHRGWYVDTYPGEIRCEPVSLFNIWWPWDAREGGIDDCMRLAHVYVDLRETLEQRFDQDLGDVETYEATVGSERYQEVIAYAARAGMGVGAAGGPHPNHASGQRVRVVEMWERPTRHWPRGRKILVVGNRVLDDGDNPYHEAGVHIPFAKTDWLQLPGRFPAISLVSQLRGPQRARNHSRSMALSIERTHGYPVTMIPNDAEVNVDRDLRSIPGVVLRISRMRDRPFVSSSPQLPPYIGENADRAQAEMSTISGQDSPGDSRIPGQLRSGLAVQAVQEDANLILSEPAFNFAMMHRDAGRIKLALAAHFYDDTRVMSTLDGTRTQVEHFTGADIRGHTQLIIAGEPGRIESSTAYQAKIMEMVQLGILNPADPRDRLATLKALEYQTADEVAEDKLRDEERAESIVRRILDAPQFAQPYQMRPWDDPFAFSRVLERHLKSDEFDDFPETVQMQLAAMWQQASAMIQERLNAQMAFSEAQKGQPGEKGAASQPRRTA